ncbi:MAG: lipid-A-disaccharide synthase [Flavisolibacter sp.]|nr:lipid-A-disaccharide synthase [Flavisolibacter sp.]MBD0350188.1 lipid-A-disaccharide synthase [Flavisolibacter sp.]MBD0364934.1 lipid-A-disaccharide synthase [Flavisolibacter sp.]MBD0374155.1 lipid-A-disaccharide synthase [Flavisolibacter sp.]
MRYYIIAGEASGDLHGSNLIRELRKMDAGAVIRCWGGDLMQAAGGNVVKHYRDLAFMGFTEVIKNLPTILNNLKFCKQDIEQFNLDVLVLIDYAGFNLRIAKWAKEKGYKIIYYISPQVWAWKESRVRLIKKVVDKMLVILPFEREFYENRWDYKVEFVGHPLVQVVNEFLATHTPEARFNKPVIALLPGSRKQEVAVKLPIMLQAAKQFPVYQFAVAKATSLEDAFYDALLEDYPGVASVRNETYNLLQQAKAALVTSGTATLETALFGVPQVVCYKGSTISYQIARRLVKIKYISLVNLIMDKPVVKELIQNELTEENVCRELDRILHDEKRIQEMKEDYSLLKNFLQQGGNASEQAAGIIVRFLTTSSSVV